MSKVNSPPVDAAVKDLFTPVKLGALSLPHRVIMAPLTRNRASDNNAPNDRNVQYYKQRAGAGLIISEATQVSPQGLGYPLTPGIHSAAQVAGWKRVVDAVHEAGGRILLQLWHVGRISHPSLQPNGETPVAPSAIKPAGEAFTFEGLQPFVTPRALELQELPGIIESYRSGAENAKRAGFDGVELHNANGYLLDQFLRDGTNKRTDAYGGSLENRARLSIEVLEAILGVWPSDRVGIRISPSGTFNDMSDSDPRRTFGYFAERLNGYDLAYLHIVEPDPVDRESGGTLVPSREFRSLFNNQIIACGDYDLDSGNRAIQQGHADAIAYGKKFLANPDLPRRFRLNAPLNEPDQASFYGGTGIGYTDYPFLDTAEAA